MPSDTVKPNIRYAVASADITSHNINAKPIYHIFANHPDSHASNSLEVDVLCNTVALSEYIFLEHMCTCCVTISIQQ
jgi:hypothetical protein